MTRRTVLGGRIVEIPPDPRTAWEIARLVDGGAAFVRALLAGDHERARRLVRGGALVWCGRCAAAHFGGSCQQ